MMIEVGDRIAIKNIGKYIINMAVAWPGPWGLLKNP